MLRSEFDAHGYDLVMAHGKVVRHIQFKAGAKPKPDKPISVSRALAERKSEASLMRSPEAPNKACRDIQIFVYWAGQ